MYSTLHLELTIESDCVCVKTLLLDLTIVCACVCVCVCVCVHTETVLGCAERRTFTHHPKGVDPEVDIAPRCVERKTAQRGAETEQERVRKRRGVPKKKS